MTNFQHYYDIQIQNVINSVDFLDVNCRFILITCPTVNYVFDSITNTINSFNATIPASSVFVDQRTSQIIFKIN